jgi:beta-galactosidase
MHAFVFLLFRTQMILGWTWRTMLAGEEQFLYGILGHDGLPTQNYREYKQLASDLKKLEPYAFPYQPDPQLAIAYSYENKMVSFRQPRQFGGDYTDKVIESLAFLDIKNYDYNIVDIRKLKRSYKVLLVPACYLMEPSAAETIRSFAHQGGTVIMTGFSAMLDETNAAFPTPRPGLLDDVFGIRVASFERTNVDWKPLEYVIIERNGSSVISKSSFYEILELKSATSYAQFSGKCLCAVSHNSYGAGNAFYVATDVDSAVLGFLLPKILEASGIPAPLAVPEGVRARKLAPGQHFFVNTEDRLVSITLPESGTGVLTGKACTGVLTLPPFEAELIVSSLTSE